MLTRLLAAVILVALPALAEGGPEPRHVMSLWWPARMITVGTGAPSAAPQGILHCLDDVDGPAYVCTLEDLRFAVRPAAAGGIDLSMMEGDGAPVRLPVNRGADGAIACFDGLTDAVMANPARVEALQGLAAFCAEVRTTLGDLQAQEPGLDEPYLGPAAGDLAELFAQCAAAAEVQAILAGDPEHSAEREPSDPDRMDGSPCVDQH